MFRCLNADEDQPRYVALSAGADEEPPPPQTGTKRKARDLAEGGAADQAGSSAAHTATAINDAAAEAGTSPLNPMRSDPAESVAAAAAEAAAAAAIKPLEVASPTEVVAAVIATFATATTAAAAAKATAIDAADAAAADAAASTTAATKFVAAADAAAAAAATEASTRPRFDLREEKTSARYPHFEKLRKATDLSTQESMLYWAYECLPYVLHIPTEPHFHDHTTALEEAIDMGQRNRDFYDGMSKPGGIAASDDQKFNFWIRFGWLACSFAIGREWGKVDDLLLNTDPPDSWEGDNKTYWWKTRLVGSPFHRAMDSRLDRAEDMVATFEAQHKNASAAAASTAAVSNAAAATANTAAARATAAAWAAAKAIAANTAAADV